MPDKNVSALIGLGGNEGDVIAAMQRAIDFINSDKACSVAAISRIYKTPPWGKTDQPWFFNACAEVMTCLGAEVFLDLFLKIELSEGRVRAERWGPRTLDLDIIDFGGQKISTPRLLVPHPRFAERAFVVMPLVDIDPRRKIAGKPVADYASGLDVSSIERVEKRLAI